MLWYVLKFTLILEVYVVDSFDIDRLEESGLQLESLLEEPKLGKIPLLVFATKQDVDGAKSAMDVINPSHINTTRLH